jgi:hypothetical protein
MSDHSRPRGANGLASAGQFAVRSAIFSTLQEDVVLITSRYGVSRVYLQQCGYVLTDAQNAHNAMRMMLKAMKDAGLDPEAGKARYEP